MRKLEELTLGPLYLLDRFRQEVSKMPEDRTMPVHDLKVRIAQFQGEIFQDGEAEFAEFVKEAESMEQELLKRVEQLQEIRERGQLMRDLAISIFRPALSARELDMVRRFFQGFEGLRQREERISPGSR